VRHKVDTSGAQSCEWILCALCSSEITFTRGYSYGKTLDPLFLEKLPVVQTPTPNLVPEFGG